MGENQGKQEKVNIPSINIPSLEEAVLGVKREDYETQEAYEMECQLRRLENHAIHEFHIITDSHIPFGKAIKSMVARVTKGPIEQMSSAQNAFHMESASAIRSLFEIVTAQDKRIRELEEELKEIKGQK